jgi:hypothetical protein
VTEAVRSHAVLAAVGWATIDLERPLVGWPNPSASDASAAGPRVRDDEPLGARAVVLDRPTGIVLLEPSTEGPIAASLARYGEGPAALYVRPGRSVDELRASGLVLSVVRRGPFGPEALVLGPRFGPHVTVVLDDSADTIRP